MDKFKIQILGVAETRWTGVGKFKIDGHEIIYSGGAKHERGVGMLFDNHTCKSILGFWGLSDRILLVKLKGQPFDLNVIQAYAPTAESDENEIELFYEDLERAKRQCKSQEITIIMGDFNAKVGSERVENIVGGYGLGIQNERGDMLIDWCRKESYMVTNTWFKNHIRRRWTWQSPSDIYKNQIDYILVPQRFKNLVKTAKTIPRADINSDHRPVKCILKLKLKRLNKSKTQPKRQIELLRKDNEIREQYKEEVKQRYENIRVTEDIEKYWVDLTKCLTEPIQDIVPSKKHGTKNKWMTPEILEMMDKRSKLEKKSIEYKQADKQIKKACIMAKEQYIDLECQYIEKQRNKNTKEFHKSIKNLTGKKDFTQGKCVRDSQGNIIMNTQDILQRWAEYIENLYSDDERDSSQVNSDAEDTSGQKILREEVAAACKEMKKGKAVGQDNISIELIDALGDLGVDILAKIFNIIYEKGVLPNELRKSVFITLPKKPGAIDCDQHRTISIMSQATKIILRIIMKRMRNKITPEIGKEQFGFVKDKGTINAIFTLKMIMQRSIEKQKKIYLCFIDYSKAFDSVQHTTLFKMLNSIGIDEKDLRLVRNLYWNQTACVKVDNETSDFFNIRKGVRQGCVLSPDLFNLYSGIIFREIENMRGIGIGGVNLTNIRYADDAVLMAYSPDDVQQMLDKLVDISETKGLLLNVKKTECMVAYKQDDNLSFNLTSKGEVIKQVKKFKYLGAIITNDCKDTTEIKQRIAMAKQTFHNIRPVVSNSKLKTDTKLQTVQTYVLSTLLYACETWTLDAQCRKRLEAFEMWIYRRLLKIPWTAKITNIEVLEKIGKERELIVNIKKRQMRFFGHVWRQNGLEKLATSGFIEGTRARGRQRTTYVTALRQNTSEITTNSDYTRSAEDRTTWRGMIGNVLNSTSHK